MDTIQQQKAALRRELAAAERTMMPEEKRLSDSAILHHVLNTQEYRLARTVFAFVGRADEDRHAAATGADIGGRQTAVRAAVYRSRRHGMS